LVRLANRCSFVVAISKHIEAELGNIGANRDRVRCIYNAIDLENIRLRAETLSTPLPDRQGKRSILLPCAALRPIKGIHLAIDAMDLLDANVHLWITGSTDDPAASDYLRELKSQIKAKGLQDRIHFLGLRRDIYAVMQRASAVVVPSQWREPFGLVAAEAMALGKPVLVSDRGGLLEVVGNERNGWICDPANRQAMASGLREMLTGVDTVQGKVRSALAWVQQQFTYSRWEREVSDVLLQSAGAQDAVG
jgi:glycosyltransferase involved in cell wall biosynthesis